MTQSQTRHAIWYLNKARSLVQAAHADHHRLSQWDALASLESGLPCAAYGMAKEAFRRARDLPKAIKSMESAEGA